MRKIALIIICGIFLVSFISASSFAYNYLDGQTVNPGGNYTINVNNSNFLQGYTPTTLKNWIQSLFNGVYLLQSNWNATNESYLQVKDWNSTNTSYIPYSGANQNISLGTDNSTLRVGIGTNTPGYILDVNGTANIYAYNVGTHGNITPVLYLSNPTQCTASTIVQSSPALVFSGNAWNGSQNVQQQFSMKLTTSAVGTTGYSTLYIAVKDGTGNWFNIWGLQAQGSGSSATYSYPVVKQSYDARETIVNAFSGTNNAGATSTYDQYSAAETYYGRGWKTAATAASQAMTITSVVAPEQGVTNPTGVWKWFYGINSQTANEKNELMRFEWGERSGLIVNENSNNSFMFRVEGDTDANLLFLNGTLDKVGIGTNAPTQKLDVNGSVVVEGNLNITGNLSVKRPYWNGYDNSTQNFLNTSAIQVINISNNNGFDAYGIHVVGSQNLTFDMTGDYLCILSPEFYQNGGGSLVTFWYQKNGVNVAWTNSRYSMTNNEYHAPSIPFQFDITNTATDNIRFMWWSDSTNTQIYSSGVLTSPARPSIPGVILNCQKVSEIT